MFSPRTFRWWLTFLYEYWRLWNVIITLRDRIKSWTLPTSFHYYQCLATICGLDETNLHDWLTSVGCYSKKMANFSLSKCLGYHGRTRGQQRPATPVWDTSGESQVSYPISGAQIKMILVIKITQSLFRFENNFKLLIYMTWKIRLV